MRKSVFLNLAPYFLMFAFALTSCVTTTPSSSPKSVSLDSPGIFAGLKTHTVTVIDPNQSLPGKPAKITYRGYNGQEVLDRAWGSREAWTQKQFMSIECADGYRSILETKYLKDGNFYFAIARTGQPSFTIFNQAKGGKLTQLGPYYLVWTDKEFQVLEKGFYWPFQIIKLHFEQ